ncbi:hypothetical protein ACFSGX_00295 [Sphingomonas arantia]|uniref:Uncharacterized protein n=1 Tax=Sphingomonas arantia TaxID=1460676 RepID=A0ABW4TUE9_9SPHN
MRIDQLHPTPTAAPPLDIPTELLASVNRHQAHLLALIESLRAAGLHEDVVESSVRTLVDSYADELTVVIGKLVQGADHE